MTEHDPSRRSEKAQITSVSSPPRGLPLAASRPPLRERFSLLRNRIAARFRNVPGLGWVIAIAAIALFIQAVGLANLIAVNDERTQWDAAANQRAGLLNEIREIESKQLNAKKELHTIKGMIDHESGRLAEVQAGLKLAQQLRDEAQREQGGASNEAARLREANTAAETKMKDYATRLASAEALVNKLEADRDQIAAELATSKKTIDDRRAEVDRAATHLKDLDAKAAATLEAIRTSRESQVKAQADLDDALKQLAKSGVEREAALARLSAASQQMKELEQSIAGLTKQKGELVAAIANDRKLADEATQAKTQQDAELAMVREKLDKASKLLAEKQGAVAAEESLLGASQTRHDAIKSRIAMLQSELKPLEEQRLAIDADIAGKKKELETLRERIDAARADLKTIPAPTPAAPPAPKVESPNGEPANNDKKEEKNEQPQKDAAGAKGE